MTYTARRAARLVFSRPGSLIGTEAVPSLLPETFAATDPQFRYSHQL